MKKNHISKVSIAIFMCLIIQTLIIVSVALSPQMSKEPLDKQIIFFVTLFATMAVCLYFNSREPLNIIEYDDKLLFKYQFFKQRMIPFSDILKYEYPIRLEKERNVTAHRITLTSGEEIILHDAFAGLGKTAQRIQSVLHRLQDEAEEKNTYNTIKTDIAPISLFPRLPAYIGTYTMVVVATECCVAIWKIADNPSEPLPYFLLFLMLVILYVLILPLSGFRIAEGKLFVEHIFLRWKKREIPLREIQWVSIQGTFLHIKTRQGGIVSVMYNLSEKQREVLLHELEYIGIRCI